MVKNSELIRWVNEMAALCQPDHVYWCDGSEEENDALLARLVQSGTVVRLNPRLRPGSYGRSRTPQTWLASRSERLSVAPRRRTPVRPITGASLGK